MTQCSLDFHRAARAKDADDRAGELRRVNDSIEGAVWEYLESLEPGDTFRPRDVRSYVLARCVCEAESPARILRKLRRIKAVIAEASGSGRALVLKLIALKRDVAVAESKKTKLQRMQERRARLLEKVAELDVAIAEAERPG
ncbi:MAG: hypothetical protein AAGE52_30375 [Myxococcota bacterium]